MIYWQPTKPENNRLLSKPLENFFRKKFSHVKVWGFPLILNHESIPDLKKLKSEYIYFEKEINILIDAINKFGTINILEKK